MQNIASCWLIEYFAAPFYWGICRKRRDNVKINEVSVSKSLPRLWRVYGESLRAAGARDHREPQCPRCDRLLRSTGCLSFRRSSLRELRLRPLRRYVQRAEHGAASAAARNRQREVLADNVPVSDDRSVRTEERMDHPSGRTHDQHLQNQPAPAGRVDGLLLREEAAGIPIREGYLSEWGGFTLMRNTVRAAVESYSNGVSAWFTYPPQYVKNLIFLYISFVICKRKAYLLYITFDACAKFSSLFVLGYFTPRIVASGSELHRISFCRLYFGPWIMGGGISNQSV